MQSDVRCRVGSPLSLVARVHFKRPVAPCVLPPSHVKWHPSKPPFLHPSPAAALHPLHPHAAHPSRSPTAPPHPSTPPTQPQVRDALDIPALVRSLRAQRKGLVETAKQYAFIYDCVTDEVKEGLRIEQRLMPRGIMLGLGAGAAAAPAAAPPAVRAAAK